MSARYGHFNLEDLRSAVENHYRSCRIVNAKVMGGCWPRHRFQKFVKFLAQLEKEIPLDWVSSDGG